jgi:phosphate transport system substrate-binding protein
MHIFSLGKTFISTLAATSLLTATVAWGSLTYNGSSTIGIGFMQAGAVDKFSHKTGIQFTSVANEGTGTGLKALAEGKFPLAGASRPLKPEEKGQGLVATTIGYDALAVIVSSDNPVKELTIAQLKGIFTGKIRNWKMVGGNDAPIIPNTGSLSGKHGTVELFQEKVLDGEKYGAGFKQFDLQRGQIYEVAHQKNAIATVSRGVMATKSSEMTGRVKIIRVDGFNPTPGSVRSGSYPISRPLYIVTKGEPRGETKTFIDYALSPAGQFIMNHGFVAVK